jgi:hypothetical protein
MKHKIKIDRSKELKEAKKLANTYLQQNIERRKSKSKGWENRVYENNIKRLTDIIYELNQFGEDSEIEKYVTDQIASDERQKTGDGSILDNSKVRLIMNRARTEAIKFNIMRHSPSYSVENDLYWITDGTIGDQIKISLGIETIDIYNKYLKDKVTIVKTEVIPFLESKKDYKSSAKILRDAIKNIDKQHYSTANILLITLVEGLVRLLCSLIYTMQNPNLGDEYIENYIYNDFLSLESLIMSGNFDPDYEISIVNGYQLSQHVISDELKTIEKEFQEFKEKSDWIKKNIDNELKTIIDKLNDTDFKNKDSIKDKLENLMKKVGAGPMSLQDKRLISIKPRLEFLLRSYKQDRNHIIHGKYSEFDKPSKSYLYLTALIKVNGLLIEYKKHSA